MNAQNKSRKRVLKISLFAPSSPPVPAKIEAGVKIITKEAPWVQINADWQTGGKPGLLPYLAAADNEQARNFFSLLESHRVDCLWGIRGGYGILRWIAMLDLRAMDFRSLPLLVGFSDLTLLHLFFLKKGKKGLHGPLIATLPDTHLGDRQSLWRCLEDGEAPLLRGKRLFSGQAEGILVGGNLTCLVSSLSTALEPEWDGKILFFEDHRESLYRIDRMLTQLLASGRLQRLNGIAVGQILDCCNRPSDLKILLDDRLRGLKIPVLWDLPVGHGERNAPLIIGARYLISGDKATLVPMEGL